MSEIEKLDTLAARINEEHRACETALKAGLGHALKAGELLVDAKKGVPHGSWNAWLQENFEGSDRTARAYMRVYSHREELEAKRQSSAVLSLDGALKALSTPREPLLEERDDKAAVAATNVTAVAKLARRVSPENAARSIGDPRIAAMVAPDYEFLVPWLQRFLVQLHLREVGG